uniref:Methylthioribulose-1-phosphate dehydratase n=1 Tax=Coralloluteibacterium stylophorae TaxID=1776034 RepID=A0A8J7VUK5_9GAMM
MSSLPYSQAAFSDAAKALMSTTAELAALGWTPATSSNFSQRLDASHAVITASGADKGRLTEGDFLAVDLAGAPVSSALRPSAETLLHTPLYARDLAGCVLHTHSRTQTVASRLFARAGRVRIVGFELIKAFAGNATHVAAIEIPVLPYTQDMPALAAEVERLLDAGPLWGYLIDGHGLYAWGRDLKEARRHLDAFEFLLACELDLRRLS